MNIQWQSTRRCEHDTGLRLTERTTVAYIYRGYKRPAPNLRIHGAGASSRRVVDGDGYTSGIVAFGCWLQKGYLVIPQLGLKFRIPPGSAVGSIVFDLAHLTMTPIGGRRVVMTCFILLKACT